MSISELRHRFEHARYLAATGLVRALPHRVARQLGRACGQPTRFDLLSAGRFGPRELCRHLSLEGWGHLTAAESRGRGIFVIGSREGLWEIAALAVGLYRGPVDLLVHPHPNPLLARERARSMTRFENRILDREDVGGEMLRVLRAGGRIGAAVDPPPGSGEAPGCDDALLIAEAALRGDTPMVPLFCRPGPSGTYLLAVREPISPRETPDPEALRRRLCRVVGAGAALPAAGGGS